MISVQIFLSCLICLILLFGCANHKKLDPPSPPKNPPYQSKTEFSKAMNVLMAAGLVRDPENSPVRDVPMEDIQKAFEEPGSQLYIESPEKLVLSLSSIALRSAGVIVDPLGFAAGLASDIWWLFSNDAGVKRHPLSKPLLIAWMPYEQHLDIKKHWSYSILAGLQEIDPGSGFKITLLRELSYQVKRPTVQAMFSKNKFKDRTIRMMANSKIAKIEGGKCWHNKLPCFYAGFIRLEHTPLSETEVENTAKVTIAPDFLKNLNPAYFSIEPFPQNIMKQRGIPVEIERSNSLINDPDFPFFELFHKTSTHLPEGFYIYLPPGIPMGPGKGKTQIPMVLDRGEILLFLKPEETEKSMIAEGEA